MTQTLRPPAPAPRQPVDKPRRGRRWLRFFGPLIVVAVLITASIVAYEIEQPDPGDSGYLAPASTDGVGGSRLAQLLIAKGIRIQRERQSSTALVAANAGDVTLFVPAPSFMHKYYVRMLKLLPVSTRVVLVAPNNAVLSNGRMPAVVLANRLQATTGRPDCDLPVVRDAGTARVVRTRYAADSDDGRVYSCYRDSVVTFRRGVAEVTLVGADEPFRNDRIDEVDNATLAVALLSGAPKVVWLDLHKREPAPRYIDNPALSSAPDAPPSLGPGTGDPDFPIAGGSQPGEPGQPPLPRADQERDQAGGSNPLWRAFPQWTYALTVLLAVALVLLALARARRIGTPVSEPLPVTVRATETVEGRGRLYRRAKARAHALAALRETEVERLHHLLDGYEQAGSLDASRPRPAQFADDLVAAAARQSGWPPEAVREALYGGTPEDDEDMVRRARALDDLHRAILRDQHRPEGDLP